MSFTTYLLIVFDRNINGCVTAMLALCSAGKVKISTYGWLSAPMVPLSSFWLMQVWPAIVVDF